MFVKLPVKKDAGESKAPETPAVDHSSRRRKLMISALIAGMSVALLMAWSSRNDPNKLRKQIEGKLSGSSEEKPAQAESNVSEEELFEYAVRLQKAGVKLMGVTQCGWTRKQREVFGTGKARRVLESIYVECRSREMCPGIQAYPTWVQGGTQHPGFVPLSGMKKFIEKLEASKDQGMTPPPFNPPQQQQQAEGFMPQVREKPRVEIQELPAEPVENKKNKAEKSSADREAVEELRALVKAQSEQLAQLIKLQEAAKKKPEPKKRKVKVEQLESESESEDTKVSDSK